MGCNHDQHHGIRWNTMELMVELSLQHGFRLDIMMLGQY